MNLIHSCQRYSSAYCPRLNLHSLWVLFWAWNQKFEFITFMEFNRRDRRSNSKEVSTSIIAVMVLRITVLHVSKNHRYSCYISQNFVILLKFSWSLEPLTFFLIVLLNILSTRILKIIHRIQFIEQYICLSYGMFIRLYDNTVTMRC